MINVAGHANLSIKLTMQALASKWFLCIKSGTNNSRQNEIVKNLEG